MVFMNAPANEPKSLESMYTFAGVGNRWFHPGVDSLRRIQIAISGAMGTTEMLPATPVNIAGLLSKPIDSRTSKLEWAEHIAVSTGHSYVWLSPGDELVLSVTIDWQSHGTEGNIIEVSGGLGIVLWRDEESLEGGPSASSNFAAILTTTTAGTNVSTPVPEAYLPAPGYGYYRLVFDETSFTARMGSGLSNPFITGIRVQIKVVRTPAAVRWFTTPEFREHPQLYRSARVTASSLLISNRTPTMFRGGNIFAATLRDEAGLRSALEDPRAFFAKTSQRPHGYTGDLSTGLYHWSRPGLEDCAFREYCSDTGSPIYRLDQRSECALVILDSPPPATGQTQAATFYVTTDVHLESEVNYGQSYGRAIVPRLMTADFERALNASSEWPVWTENPVHVTHFLRRIGNAAWSTFRFAAPHIIQAAQLAAAGATPTTAALSLLKSAL
jgi:hypothetical protein